MKSDRNHPFFCHKKQCRKTAWETPEYLTESDWLLLSKLAGALEARDKKTFDKILYPRYERVCTEDRPDYVFFYRILGWPEGWVYYPQATTDNYFLGFVDRDLPKLTEALKTRNGS